MKAKVGSAFVVLAVLLLLVLPSVLRLHSYAADKNVPANADLLDINTATAEQLKAFPGIGDAYSDKIIERRPYKRKDERVQKVIPEVTYDEIKDQIVARQK